MTRPRGPRRRRPGVELTVAEAARHRQIMDVGYGDWPDDLRRHVARRAVLRGDPDRVAAAVAEWVAGRRPPAAPPGLRRPEGVLPVRAGAERGCRAAAP